MQAMEEFARWLEQMVEHYGIIRTILGPLAMVGVASAFGVQLNNAEARTVLVVLLVVAVMTIIAALMVRARSLRAEVATKSITLAGYAELLERNIPLDFVIESWNESLTIGKNGDTIIERKLKIRVLDNQLFFCWGYSGSFGHELSQAERNKVTHEVRWMTPDGAHRGPRVVTTYRWNGNKKIVFAHFDEALAPGSDAWLYFKWTWPRYSILVKERATERFTWTLRQDCKELAASIQILPEAGLQGLRATAFNNVPAPERSTGSDGSRHIKFAIQTPPRERTFGFTLDAN